MSGDLDLEDATSEPASENEFEEIGTGKEEASDDMMAERKPLPLDENEAAVAAAAAAAKAKADAKDPLRPRRKKARRACFACQRAHLTCGMVLSFFIFFLLCIYSHAIYSPFSRTPMFAVETGNVLKSALDMSYFLITSSQ